MEDIVKVLIWLAIAAVVIVVGFFLIGTLIWALPFLLAVGVVGLIIYGVFRLVCGKK